MLAHFFSTMAGRLSGPRALAESSSLDWDSFEKLKRLLETLYSTAILLLCSADFKSSNIVWSISLHYISPNPKQNAGH